MIKEVAECIERQCTRVDIACYVCLIDDLVNEIRAVVARPLMLRKYTLSRDIGTFFHVNLDDYRRELKFETLRL